jgi:tetratricopeptide (TPR) repeat protein
MAVDERRYRFPGTPAWVRSALSESPALPAQLLAVAGFLVLAATEAGFGPTVWYPAALFLLGLLAVTAAVLGRPPRPGRAVVAGLALLCAYAAWSYLSITWAEQQADSWDAANRVSAYAMVVALFSLWPLAAGGARLCLGVFSLGIAGLGLVEILRADGSAFPGGFFIDVRFAEPAGYINANVALWTLGLLGCLALAATRRAHPALRATCLGGAALLAGLGLLGQSRGWVVALPLGVLALLVLSPDRLRVAFGSVAVGVGVLAVRGPILDVHDAYTPGRFDGLLADATAYIVLMAVAVALAGALWAVGERGVRLAEPAARRLGRAAGLALAVLALAAGGVALAATDDPTGRVEEAWSEFKEGGGPDPGGSRFASGGSNRWDFWTVAWDAFRDNPVRGIGAENFQRLYLRVGDSTEKPRYPHSLELGVLSQLGLVGALLLGGAILALVAAAARARAAPYERRALAAACGAVFAYWLAHASIDWFWEFPGLTAPALAMLGMAAALARPAPPRPGERGGRARPVLLGAGAAAAALLAVSLAAPWLSALYVDRAAAGWREDAEGAFDDLDRAAWLNPLSEEPDATAGTIALRLGRTAEARRRFGEVLANDTRNAYAAFELGLIASEAGRRGEAVRLLRRSLTQNPRDDLVRGVLERVEAGETVSPARVNARIASEARSTADRPRGPG